MSDRTQGRIICAWCDKDMGKGSTADDTHGICELCRQGVDRELKSRGKGGDAMVYIDCLKCGGSHKRIDPFQDAGRLLYDYCPACGCFTPHE